MTDTTHLRGVLFALGATVIWSGNFIVARLLNQSIEPATLSLLRWGVDCICTDAIALIGPDFQP